MKRLTLLLGNRVLLECEVQCQEKMPIQAEWYHNGRLLATTRTLRTYFDGRLAMLKIYDAQREHDGNYECRFWIAGAENQAVMSSANVYVEGLFNLNLTLDILKFLLSSLIVSLSFSSL